MLSKIIATAAFALERCRAEALQLPNVASLTDPGSLVRYPCRQLASGPLRDTAARVVIWPLTNALTRPHTEDLRPAQRVQ